MNFTPQPRARHLSLVVAAVALSGTVPVALHSAEAATNTTTVAATADSFTRYDARKANYGSLERWSVDGRSSVKRRAYLKFQLPHTPSGATLTKVTLSAYVENDGASTSPGPIIRRTSNAWAENTLTWANQPALGTQVATTDAPYGAGVWVSWDVTAGLSATERAQGGTVSFAMRTSEKKWLGFRSRETTQAPVLTVTTTAPADPTDPSTQPEPLQAAVAHSWGSVVAGDEFNYSGAPDGLKWNVYKSLGHAGNGLRSPAQVTVNGSALQITGLPDGTTGGISHKVRGTTYGRWEARMRVNARDPEYHPVMILWPDAGRVPENNCAEIDYAESTSNPATVKFFLHHGCNREQSQAVKTLDMTVWHNYAVEWTPNHIVGYIDGDEWFRDSDPVHVPDDPAHQTIQLDWFPDGTTTTESWMQVDWVRLYNIT